MMKDISLKVGLRRALTWEVFRIGACRGGEKGVVCIPIVTLVGNSGLVCVVLRR
jgi:hypothetical protein